MDNRDRTVRRRIQRTLEFGRIVLAEIPRRRPRRRWPHLARPEDERLRSLLCAWIGRERGGRPPRERRCTKRLGSRLCWNWRIPGADRCWRHPRG